MTTTAPAEKVADDFREAMRRLAAAVVMVTTWMDGQPWGLTVSACCSVSMTPPSLLVSVGEYTATARAIRHEHRFGVSILGQQQADVAKFGARPREPKFVSQFCDEGTAARGLTPVVRGAVAHVDCLGTQEMVSGDHLLFIGEVQRVVLHPDARPLIYYASDFHRVERLMGASEPESEGLLYPPW
ncbi:MAG TPA: flavin reductase family protein [Solirubrobacteraceae bacterium]|jgi:flavin reductase ActVB|nr:flavin reductase family protein [Solirubrobacteraceae bacterium]